MARHLRLAPERGVDSDATGVPPLRVVLAEDHELMRRSLVLLLERDPGVELVAEARDLGAAVTHVLAANPAVLVLDLGLPNGSSVEAIGDLRARAPETQIVVLTMNDDPACAKGALSAGARGFVLKQLADEELTDALEAVARGEQYVSPRVARRLGWSHLQPVRARAPRAASSER